MTVSLRVYKSCGFLIRLSHFHDKIELSLRLQKFISTVFVYNLLLTACLYWIEAWTSLMKLYIYSTPHT